MVLPVANFTLVIKEIFPFPCPSLLLGLKSSFKTASQAKRFNSSGAIEDYIDLVIAEFRLIKQICIKFASRNQLVNLLHHIFRKIVEVILQLNVFNTQGLVIIIKTSEL